MVQKMQPEVAVCPQQRGGIEADLSVGVRDADVNSDHDENGDWDSEISNQTTNLREQTANHTSGTPFSILPILQQQNWILLGQAGNDQT